MNKSKSIFKFKSFYINSYPEWVAISRIKSEKMLVNNRNFLNEDYGESNWKVGFIWKENIIDQSEALILIENSYNEYFEEHPEILAFLSEIAQDIFINSEKDIQSGLKYSLQESRGFHYADIAIRKVMENNNIKFLGEHIIKIVKDRETIFNTEFSKQIEINNLSSLISPGYVPFSNYDLILESNQKGWWKPGSIEDFWRSNKAIIAKGNSVVNSTKTAVALVFRKDLKLGLGKFAVQASHGLVSAILTRGKSNFTNSWLNSNRDIELRKVSSYDKLIDLKEKSAKYDMSTTIIRDAGYTQIPSGTTTCLAIGPAPKQYLNHLLNCFEAEKLK